VGALGNVLGTLNEIGHQGNGGNSILDKLGFPDGIVLDAVEKHPGLEDKKIILVGGQIFLKSRGTVFLGIAVGVLTVRKEYATDVHALRKEEIDSPQGSLDAGRVSIIKDRDIGRIAFDEAYLLGSEGSSAGGYGVFNARLVHRDNVDVTLDKIAFISLGDS
jgi:hypothetical protein